MDYHINFSLKKLIELAFNFSVNSIFHNGFNFESLFKFHCGLSSIAYTREFQIISCFTGLHDPYEIIFGILFKYVDRSYEKKVNRMSVVLGKIKACNSLCKFCRLREFSTWAVNKFIRSFV